MVYLTEYFSTEHTNAAKKRDGDLLIPALVQSNDALAEPIKIPGMNYLEININGKGFERSLLWQLKWWSFLYVPPPHHHHPPSSFHSFSQNPKCFSRLTYPRKLITLMLFGYRMEAISILGREVMQPRGLIGLGYDSLDHCGPEIASALRAFSQPANLPILAHCTQGKDRTGLIIALILFLLHVPTAAITQDYTLSEGELLPERAARMKEISSIGLTEDFAGCPVDWVGKMEGYIHEKYGGVERYCDGIGLSDDEVRGLRKLLSY